MITYEGKKYACVSCIRGHRSSSCDHRERPLIQVRKRGRPLPEDSPRIALVPETKTSDHVLKTLPEVKAEEIGLIYTDKYVFEPAGNGLYRKHLLSEFSQERQESPWTSSIELDPQLIAPMNLTSGSFQEIGVTQEEASSIWPRGHPDFIPSCVMPDQCQCGDSCACPNCFTHGHRVLRDL